MEVTGYTVQKLTRQYAVTRLATAGDEPLAEGLRVETTPLRTLANTILDDLRARFSVGSQGIRNPLSSSAEISRSVS
jgi:hypothetical protein